jgi:molecular chaperone DnaK (HSP70)
MPMVANGMRERYGWEPRLTELDLAVAKGAALYGQRAIAVSGDADGGGASDAAAEGDGGGRSRGRRLVSGPALQVNNVLSRGVGVKFVTEDSPQDAPDFYIEFLAHAQDTLPAAPHCTAATASDGQTQVVINVYEQNSDIESEAVASNRELTVDGGLYITGLPSLPKGSPVEITIDISSDGIATIEAFEPSTGQKVMANLSLAVMQAADQKLATEIVAGLKRAEY